MDDIEYASIIADSLTLANQAMAIWVKQCEDCDQKRIHCSECNVQEASTILKEFINIVRRRALVNR